MRKHNFILVAALATLLLASLACGFSVSTANIKDAYMARDGDGNEKTTTFAQDEKFYCIVELANAPDDTVVKAVWYAVEAEGTEPNLKIDEASLTTGDGTLTFDLTNDMLWPLGKYKVELYINDELAKTVEFEVR